MEPILILQAALVLAVVAAVGFVGWVSTSSSRSAGAYRRKWKEYKLKNRSRNTTKYRGTAAGSGSSAKDRRIG